MFIFPIYNLYLEWLVIFHVNCNMRSEVDYGMWYQQLKIAIKLVSFYMIYEFLLVMDFAQDLHLFKVYIKRVKFRYATPTALMIKVIFQP